MERSKDAMKWTEWVSDRGIEPELRKRRKVLLDELAKANGKDSVDELLNDI